MFLTEEEELKIKETINKYENINGKLSKENKKALNNQLFDYMMMIGEIPNAENIKLKTDI